MAKILVSACLLGVECRYKGDSVPCQEVIALKDRHTLIPVCPEQAGGLPTPRIPSERVGDKVISKDGRDVTAEYDKGAQTALYLAKELGADFAILGSYSRGDTVEVVDHSSGYWYAVDYDGTIGYMSAAYVVLQPDGNAVILTDTPLVQAPVAESGGIVVTPGLPDLSAGANGQITGTYVRFRSGPSSTSSILGEFN